MKSNPSPSAPLNLCAPVGVTGTTLADLPDRRTVWEMRVDGSFLRWCGTLEQFRKDCEEYCDRSKGHWEKVTSTEFRFISPEEPKITHFKAVKKGVDSVVESSATLPASPVKDTPVPVTVCECLGCGLVHPWSLRNQCWSMTACPKCGDMTYKQVAAPASPVESVGVQQENPYDLGLDLPLVWSPTDSGSVMHAQQAVIMDDNGFKLAECSTEFARAACRGLNGYASHAAKDAKIKALEDAGKELLEAGMNPFESEESMQRLYDARADFSSALALPCAPLGS